MCISGSYGEWMNYHPQSLSCAIPLLLQGLGNPEVAMAATMALKDITRETLEHIQPFVPQILPACQVRICFRSLLMLDSLFENVEKKNLCYAFF